MLLCSRFPTCLKPAHECDAEQLKYAVYVNGLKQIREIKKKPTIHSISSPAVKNFKIFEEVNISFKCTCFAHSNIIQWIYTYGIFFDIICGSEGSVALALL